MKIKKCLIYVKKIVCLDVNDENDENDENNDNDENDEIVEIDEKFKKYKKVKSHCHYTEKFAAHSICSLRHKVPKNIPIVIHNVGYATHFMIDKLAG